MSKANTGYRHIRVMQQGKPATKGGVTIAFKSPVHLQDLTASDVVEVGFAFCSAQDVFSRAAGRTVADIRLATPLAIPGDHFLDLIHQVEPAQLVHQLPGLDGEQHKAFAERVSKVYS